MKAVLTCGHPDSGYRLAQEALVSAGLAQAQPSRRDSVAAEALHDGIFKAHNSESFGRQLVPGQAWKDLAVDLLAANEGQELWGWADARIAWLLDFWKSLDQGIGFVLVYSAPEIAVAKMLRSSAGTPENVDKAIASWMAWNMEMLRFYNRNPGRCLLVNVLAVAHAPARFV